MANKYLPRFFLLIFCTLYVQNVLTRYPNLLTKFLGDVDQAKKQILQKHRKIPLEKSVRRFLPMIVLTLFWLKTQAVLTGRLAKMLRTIAAEIG